MALRENLYISGHSDSVLRWHSARTAANSAAYLLDSIRPDMHILDIGCGPGSITADLAALVPQGQVVGIDVGPVSIEEARKMANERGLKNVTFDVGDAHALDFPNHFFDIVHAHQVLQHAGNPPHALREWHRVTKPGGIIACREADAGSAAYYPESDDLAEFREMYAKAARSRNGEPNGGRHLIAWARAAGIERSQITATASVWLYSSPDERRYWAEMWASRITSSDLRKNVIEGGYCSQSDLDRYVEACRKWAADEDGWWTLLHGEILCHV
ncbi:hypothetical protein P7C71_g4963, partial [Lecanoromycetidae sp. Uapishka_2]